MDPRQSQSAIFAVVDGSTFTFPSLYLAMHGAVSVRDSCSVRGNTYYNPTIAVPPRDLSTLSYFSNYIDFAGYPPQTGVYDPAVCRTYGLSNGSTTSFLDTYNGNSSWITSAAYSVGSPYNPIVLPPKQLTALDPEWEACTAWDNYGDNAYDLAFGLYDPPRVMTLASALVDQSTTPSAPITATTSQSPQPAGSVFSADPKITASPQNNIDPSPPNDPSFNEKTSTADLIPLKDPSPQQKISAAGLVSVILQPFRSAYTGMMNPDDPTNTTAGSASPHLNQLIQPQYPGTNPPNSDPPFMTCGDTLYHLASPTTITSSNLVIISPNPLGNSAPILTIDSNAYTANQASQYIISHQILSPGGSTININGIPYSLAPPATQLPSVASLVSALSSPGTTIVTVNGKAYTANQPPNASSTVKRSFRAVLRSQSTTSLMPYLPPQQT